MVDAPPVAALAAAAAVPEKARYLRWSNCEKLAIDGMECKEEESSRTCTNYTCTRMLRRRGAKLRNLAH